MQWYNADIGSGERRHIFSFQAKNPEHALKVAQEAEEWPDKLDVTQIRLGAVLGPVVYDMWDVFYSIED